jgi:hypothetical protein
MTEDGYKIGIPELYQEIRSLGDRLTEYVNRQDVTSSTQSHRIAELEKDFSDLNSRLETETLRRSNTNFQIKMAFLTALVFPIVVGVVVALMIAKG